MKHVLTAQTEFGSRLDHLVVVLSEALVHPTVVSVNAGYVKGGPGVADHPYSAGRHVSEGKPVLGP